MTNFINATASTLLVAGLALFAGRMTSPEPASPQNSAPAAAASLGSGSLGSANQNQVLSEMLSTLGKINSRLESAPVGSGFDSAGSDGATNTPTWPTPTNPARVTPSTSGSGSTGNKLYSAQPIVTYFGSDSYGSSYGSTGGYSQPTSYSNFSNSSRLFSRIRARTAQPARTLRSTSTRNVICVDGVCYY